MRVLLFTSQDIGFEVVKALRRRQELSLFVVADRSARDDLYGYRSAIDACAAHDIPCVKATRIDHDLHQRIAAFAPDIIISVYYPHLIHDHVLALSRTVAVNVHPGILPRYRGKFPTPWYILNGEKKFGLAIHELNKEIDAGNVFVQELYDIPDKITGHELYRLTMSHGAKLIDRHLGDIATGRLQSRPQQGIGSYYGTFEKSFLIDWGKSCEHIERRIRVHAKPYLPAYSKLFNHLVFINRAEPVVHPGYTAQLPGKILQVRADGEFVVNCADGCLLIQEYECGPTMSAEESSRHVRVGNRFEYP
jgi:methionyl-tRNA formyltransferase